jgi:hypothetical protein
MGPPTSSGSAILAAIAPRLVGQRQSDQTVERAAAVVERAEAGHVVEPQLEAPDGTKRLQVISRDRAVVARRSSRDYRRRECGPQKLPRN